AMLEKFLNDLGRDEWEIVHYHSTPDNLLAFTGLARRSTQRDWTLADAAAAAAKAEAEKLRAEFAAKFEAATRSTSTAGGAEAPPASFIEEKSAPDDGFRKPVDTSRDDDPEASDEPKDDWDNLTASAEEELPVFFDAIKPHLRRNQRGAGMSVGTDYLAKKWDQTEEDLKGALVECGFVLPADEDSRAEYVEYDGDLYWLNINRRGELWINTKEKPRPVFRTVKATRIEQPAEEPKPEPAAPPAAEQPPARPHFETRARREAAAAELAPTDTATDGAPSAAQAPVLAASTGAVAPVPAAAVAVVAATPLPASVELLNKIRPHMRRNRRGPGGSGSTSFLARALRRTEPELIAAFAAIGLILPANPNDKPVAVMFGEEVWWVNQDSRGGVWINGRDKAPGEVLAPADQLTPAAVPAAESAAPAPTEPASTPAETAAIPVATAAIPVAATAVEPATPPPPAMVTPVPAVEAGAARVPSSVLAAVRLLLKETRTGGFAGKLDRVADELSKSSAELTAALLSTGLQVPAKAKEKPVFVEHAGEIFWLNKNAKDELWVNAKASKFAAAADDGDEKKPARRSSGGGGGRSRKKE
ncbi:MAG: hypothetical protein NTX09_13445, partial [Verrucomicrobia bacterium]|nr:hypothetical protein [Verrucomicrobiota bacterium]